MNAERLHVIAQALVEEMEESELVGNLAQLRDSLQNVVSQPQQPTHQQSLSQKQNQLYEQLEKARSNHFSPAWKQVLKEIGAEPLLGLALAKRVRSVFAENQLTPAVGLEEIRKLYEEVKGLSEALDQLTTAFATFNISAQDLQPGECEFGILVPRKAVDNRLDEFVGELHDINFILANFSEVVADKRDSFEIRSLSSSDLTIYLGIAPAVAAAIAHAFERVIAAYKTILEIRKLHADLRKQDVPDDKLEGIEEHAKDLMQERIDAAVQEVMDSYMEAHSKKMTAERKNELKNGLRISLNMLANRIDRGYNVEVRVEPMEPEKGEGAETEEQKTTRRLIAEIQEKAAALEFLKLEGEPILALPEPEEAKGGGKSPKKS